MPQSSPFTLESLGDAPGACRLAVRAAPDTGSVLITGLGLGEPARVPAPGAGIERDGVRVLPLPGDASGRTAALVIGASGRSLLWAPEPVAFGEDALEALTDAGLDGAVLAYDRFAGRVATLRRIGALAADAELVALTGDALARGAPSGRVRRLLGAWGARPAVAGEPIGIGGGVRVPRRTLILGASGSGKSELAEAFLAAEPEVTYLATGQRPEPGADPEWQARIEAHARRRPGNWTTDESGAEHGLRIAADPGAAVLFDSVGGWVSAVLMRIGAFEDPSGGWGERWDGEVRALASDWNGSPRRLVAVGEETGWGVVPASAAGRLFRDRLGEVNRVLAAGADSCLLVVAGRVLELDD